MESILADLARLGVPLVGINVLLQQLGLPIPAVPTLMLAGALVADGRLSGGGVFAIAVAAVVFADTLWFWAGRHFGYPVLRLLCRVSLSPDSCVRQTEGIFERWGFYSVVASKFVPGFSIVAPPVAGALRMPVGKFLLAATLSAMLWAGAAIGAGALFRPQIEAILRWIGNHAGMAAMVAGALLAAYVFWKAVQRWRLARFVEGARIGIDQLRTELAGEAPPFVVDVGSRIAQESRPHIPGAVMLDLDSIASGYAFPPGRALVFYCACPNEESSRRAAQLAVARGFRNARPLVGGIDGWIAAGHAVDDPPPAPEALDRKRAA